MRRPRIKGPRIPKIKKPSTLKRKRIVKKLPTISKKSIQPKLSSKKSIPKKKVTRKIIVGTCYSKKDCKGVLSKKVTKTQCRDIGGKSWKKIDGSCEIL